MISAIVAAGLAVASTAEMPIAGCRPVDGLDRVLRSEAIDWIFVGEPHGTDAGPAAFAEVVCNAAKHRKVIVAVEQPVSSQAAIDKFMDSDGQPAARFEFLQSSIWTDQLPDGRTSVAMFSLFKWLRQQRAAGRIEKVLAAAPNTFGAGEAHERALAQNLLVGAREKSLVIFLVGNVHARLNPGTFASYSPAASLFPSWRTHSIKIVFWGGHQWACQSMTECGPSALPPTSIVPAGVAQDRFSLKEQNPSATGYSSYLIVAKEAVPSPPVNYR